MPANVNDMTVFSLITQRQNSHLLRSGLDVQFIGLTMGLGQVAWAVAALPVLENEQWHRSG